MILRYTILLSTSKVFIALLLSSCSMYDIKKQPFQNADEDGTLYSDGYNMTKKAKKMDRYDYYIRWDAKVTEYYSTGLARSESFNQYKSSSYGRPCGELVNLTITYYENGEVNTWQRDKCDCKKSVIKRFDESGELITKRKVKIKRVH